MQIEYQLRLELWWECCLCQVAGKTVFAYDMRVPIAEKCWSLHEPLFVLLEISQLFRTLVSYQQQEAHHQVGLGETRAA